MSRITLLLIGLVTAIGACGPTAKPAPVVPASAPADSLTQPVDAAEVPDDKEPVPRFAKVPVGDSGLFLYAPTGMPPFELAMSEDKSKVYSAELVLGRYTFVAIGVQLADPAPTSDTDRDAIIGGYLDYLAGQIGATATAGHGRGHTLDGQPHARGTIDYWQLGADGDQAQVIGWIDRQHLAVLIVHGPGEYPYLTAWEMYRNGIRFPGAP